MTSVEQDVYGANLASSGKLKLRAKALLARGTSDAVFDACVLLHEAARKERCAIAALSVCPPVTLLTSAVEVCWCLVEGLDPPRAAEAWGDVLRARAGLERRQADAILERLTSRYSALQRDFAQTLGSSAILLTLRDSARLVGLAPADRIRARKELAALLQRFPGATAFHWLDYRLAEADDAKKAAWDALERARWLEPDNSRFRAMSLLVAAWALTLAAAEQHLAGRARRARARRTRSLPDVRARRAHARPQGGRKGAQISLDASS